MVNTDSLLTTLKKGIGHLGLKEFLGNWQCELLLEYLELLFKWNKIYSLTAIKCKKRALIYHILDGLTVIKPIITLNTLQSACESASFTLLDVGSGMGVPGIIIAICFLHEQTKKQDKQAKHIVLIDSNHKKTAFLQQVTIELGLKNVTVVHGRIEDFRRHDGFDVIISRAFSNVSNFISLTKDYLKPQGVMMLMKSNKLTFEMQELIGKNTQANVDAIPSVHTIHDTTQLSFTQLELNLPFSENSKRYLLLIS